MNTITISKVKYAQLKKQADAYKKFVSQFYTLVIKDPINEVVEDFKKTNLYSDEFINDLEDGLRKSSYAKKYANNSVAKRSNTFCKIS